MKPTEATLATAIDALRASGADRADPIRFRLIEALHRRAAAQTGAVQDTLNTRVHQLLADYASRTSAASSAESAAPSCQPARSPLAALLSDIKQIRAASTSPEVSMLDDFRNIWAKLSAETQLRQSLELEVPSNAGPLNSSSLVHRALLSMRELSPAYLRQFLSYVDALSWLEQMSADSAPPSRETTRGASARKSGRSKAR
ncbi:DUF2894 domain-containing protein [Ralstonia sp. R-29]|uniref:DUF2894 domain-containing protein n=1 Tax=Ralstonia sp. R-29 TaxID=3404059 RepID=UPI003CED15D9